MTHGGARKGAGKPKGKLASHTLEAQELKKALISSYVENSKDIHDALMAKAKTGDVPAIKEVFDRVYGKAPQAITGEDGGALKIAFDSIFKDATSR